MQPTFTQRIAVLRRVAYKLHDLATLDTLDGGTQDAAGDIREAADVVLAEVQRMEASAKRFKERRTSRAPRATTEAGR
jgi:hypothetical protein